MSMKKFLTRNYSLLGMSLMMDAWADAARSAAVTGIPDVVRDVEYGRTMCCLDDEWIESFCNRYVTAAIPLYRQFLERGEAAGNRLCLLSRELWEVVEPTRAPLSTEALAKFLAWDDAFRDNASFILVTHPMAKAVEVRLMRILAAHGVPADRLDQAILDLSVTRKSNAAEEENFDLFFIQKRMDRHDFDLDEALAEHTRRHAYLKYRDPFSGGYTVDDFRARLAGKLELPNYLQPYADIIGQLAGDEKALAEIQEGFVFYRTFRTERSYEGLYYLERFLESLETTMGLEPHELSYYTRPELIDFLRSGQSLPAAVVGDRRRDFAIELHGAAVTVFTGPAAAGWFAKRSTVDKPKAREVRGLTAFRGSAKGRARIVTRVADQDLVEPGDILIVAMTTPDYLPSMQKAAAFVTDEGGVICHAAIIARELKKPCIIGTRTATVTFRDGDWVEVDGFSGTVRLLDDPGQ